MSAALLATACAWAGAEERLVIEPRSQWRAAEPRKPYALMVPRSITIHHTETNLPLTKTEAIAELRAIQGFHQRQRGWIDSGYHFLIDGAGRVYRGRPEIAVGAHVDGRNTGNIGVALMGSFHARRAGQRPTPEQMRSLVRLLRWLVVRYRIDPRRIRAHRDQEATSCPGDRLYARMGPLRRAAAMAIPGVAGRALAPAHARRMTELAASGLAEIQK